MAGRRKPQGYRDIDGILILDKPAGISSNHALQQVRRLYRARKAGHCGSLDPLATGVLPVCLGQATRFSSYLLGASKTYRACAMLGRITTTGDSEGEVIASRPVNVSREQVEAVLPRFIGAIEQVPPMYSAIRHEGRRLYQLAREGRQVERKPRGVEVYSLELLSFDHDSFEFEVCCSKGTYVRTLAEDIGNALDCGAHLTALRRGAVGQLMLKDAVSVDRLQQLAAEGSEQIDRLLLPVSAALDRFSELRLDAAASLDIRHGRRVKLAHAPAIGLYRLVSDEGRFMGLGEVGPDAELAAKRLMNTAR
ncbi:MAG: tRNA pseudouridine(55) synthase TruB [Gammaproteobacteria bacterium]|nr:MAG: tRNA pseudouridine(55) synthase TruB [Gammaproteobacteria bacterium]